MSVESLNAIVARAREGIESAIATSAKVDRSVVRADRVMRQLDTRDGAVRDAARRERQRLNASLKRKALQIGVAIGAISIATIMIEAKIFFLIKLFFRMNY
jgi:hypothetical protein